MKYTIICGVLGGLAGVISSVMATIALGLTEVPAILIGMLCGATFTLGGLAIGGELGSRF